MRSPVTSSAILSLHLLGCAALHASAVIYTSKSTFDAALVDTGAVSNVVDFESFADNTLITPLPQAVGGLTFESFSTAGYNLIVDNQFGGTSGSNYLRVTDDGGTSTNRFGFDDSIELSFAQPSNALGLYLIVSNTTFDFFQNDINITVNGNTYSNNGTESAVTVNGVAALFFGIVDNSLSFTTASIFVGDIGAGLGDYDDITYSVVPEPAHIGIAVGSLAFGLVLLHRRRCNAISA
jgi:hypothetical protein